MVGIEYPCPSTYWLPQYTVHVELKTAANAAEYRSREQFPWHVELVGADSWCDSDSQSYMLLMFSMGKRMFHRPQSSQALSGLPDWTNCVPFAGQGFIAGKRRARTKPVWLAAVTLPSVV
jgi:hypothetical protein